MPGHAAESFERAIERIDAIRTQPPSAVEIEKARNWIGTTIIGGLDRLGGFGGVADRLNMYNHYLARLTISTKTFSGIDPSRRSPSKRSLGNTRR